MGRSASLVLVLVFSTACSRSPEPASPLADSGATQPFAPPACTREVPDNPPLRVPYFSQGKWGLADRHGVLVVDPIYDEIKPYERGHMAVRRGEAWGLIHGDGEELIAIEWAQIGSASPTRVVAHDRRGRVHLRDLCDQVALPGRYDGLDPRGLLHIARRDHLWALLDERGDPVVGWSDAPMRRFGPVILREHEDGRTWALHEDGQVWAQVFEDGLVELIWPGQPALLTVDRPYTDEARACLHDENGDPLVDCATYRELQPVSEAPPLLWAKTDAGWGLIELSGSRAGRSLAAGIQNSKIRIEHRYSARTRDGLTDGIERIVVDANGQIIRRLPAAEIERGPLPDKCGELTTWRRMNFGLEYLDGEGEIRERTSSDAGLGRWQPILERERWGVRDACSRRWIVAPDYEQLQRCGEAHILALGTRGYDLYALEHSEPFVAHLDVPLASCEGNQIFTHFGGARGLLALDGRELLPPRFLSIRRVGDDDDSLLRLNYFNLFVFASTDGVRYFDEPLPAPGEFPETSARVLSLDDLRGLDHATLRRMREDLRARCRYFRLKDPGAGNAPIEAANLELLERALEHSNDAEPKP